MEAKGLTPYVRNVRLSHSGRRTLSESGIKTYRTRTGHTRPDRPDTKKPHLAAGLGSVTVVTLDERGGSGRRLLRLLDLEAISPAPFLVNGRQIPLDDVLPKQSGHIVAFAGVGVEPIMGEREKHVAGSGTKVVCCLREQRRLLRGTDDGNGDGFRFHGRCAESRRADRSRANYQTAERTTKEFASGRVYSYSRYARRLRTLNPRIPRIPRVPAERVDGGQYR